MTRTIIALLAALLFASATGPAVKIAGLKYNGGGDWYANKSSLPNLIEYCNQNLQTNISKGEDVVEVGSADLFQSNRGLAGWPRQAD